MIHLDRLKFLTGFIFILGIVIIGRLFQLQILEHDFFEALAKKQTVTQPLISVDRGEILLDDGENFYPIATNITRYNLIAIPARIKNVSDWVKKIAPYLDIKLNYNSQKNGIQFIKENQEKNVLKNTLERLSNKNDFYELLKKDLTVEEVNKIKKLNLEGINFQEVSKRFYPEKKLFGQVTGFVDNKGEGQYGLEGFLNSEFSQGNNAVLTLDRSIQFFVCQTLQEAITKYDAEGGTIVVEDPGTGDILAMCNEPSFDPNNYWDEKEFRVFKNSAISDSFEPGSIFKVITMAASLNEGKITPQTTYIDKGQVKIGKDIIKNSDNKVYGKRTMTNVLEKSINTGAIFAARSIGINSFRNYIKKFGFGALTGIGLSGESSGDISNLFRDQGIYLATASFGQGISVTPIQMVNAISSIANGGRLMAPHIVKQIIKKDNQIIDYPPKFVRQVISSSTATSLTAMMVSTIDNGYGKKAQVPAYFVAGKTGTAQIADPDGGYSDKVMHSFVGFAPATKPAFVALVKLINPKKGRFSDSTAAPVFGKIARFILRYYGVRPDKSL